MAFRKWRQCRFDNFEFGKYASFDDFINELLGRFGVLVLAPVQSVTKLYLPHFHWGSSGGLGLTVAILQALKIVQQSAADRSND